MLCTTVLSSVNKAIIIIIIIIIITAYHLFFASYGYTPPRPA